jgi:hypothetical protein
MHTSLIIITIECFVSFIELHFVFIVLFLLAIVLSVFVRYTDSDCPFGIFKLFLLQVVSLLSDWGCHEIVLALYFIKWYLTRDIDYELDRTSEVWRFDNKPIKWPQKGLRDKQWSTKYQAKKTYPQ